MIVNPSVMRKIILIIPLLLSLASITRADVIFGNLAAYNDGNGTPTQILGSADGTAGARLWKGVGITMGSVAYTLTSVDLRLRNVNGVTDLPTVSIYVAHPTNNRPSTFIATLTNPTFSDPTVATNYTFTAASPITLNASARYIIVVQQLGTAPVGSDTTFEWLTSSSTMVPTGVAGTAWANSPYANGSSPGTNSVSYSGAYNWIQLNGAISAVPEPSTYVALTGAAVLAVAIGRRRRSV